MLLHAEEGGLIRKGIIRFKANVCDFLCEEEGGGRRRVAGD
jgi:hypothetical protein